jgi:hypothetical protein
MIRSRSAAYSSSAPGSTDDTRWDLRPNAGFCGERIA